MALARIVEFPDFQAEYEGSIPFTRSNVFRHLSQSPVFILTNPVNGEFPERRTPPACAITSSLSRPSVLAPERRRSPLSLRHSLR
jgi:hypothetical protein